MPNQSPFTPRQERGAALLAALTAPDALPCLLDERDATAMLNVAKNTLNIWRMKGQGPKYVKLGRMVRYHSRDLLEYIENSVRTSTSDTGRS